jgi:hypothetical protein
MNANAARTQLDADQTEWASAPGPGIQDLSTREGATRLKETIEAYWRAQGREVLVSIENMGFHAAIRAARYEVRSDMVDGLPRSKRR